MTLDWTSDPVVYAIPFFNSLIALEFWVIYREQKELYNLKDAAASISMGIGSVVVNLLMKVVAFMSFSFFYYYSPAFLADFLHYSNWWAWLLLFFADDFTFYIHHRMSHEVRIFWAAHVNHHSSQEFNLSTALRQSWTELLYKYFWWCWLALIGFSPWMILTMISISLIYQFWIHTERIHKFPRWFEFFFNTPSHHRVHHASNIRYLDRNHAGILIIWDRLLGTFEPESEEKVIYGITSNIHTYNPLRIASHEFINLWKDIKRADNWGDKLRYIWKPPGWSHDGPDETAAFLRQKLKGDRRN